jgi:hypothetical protein
MQLFNAAVLCSCFYLPQHSSVGAAFNAAVFSAVNATVVVLVVLLPELYGLAREVLMRALKILEDRGVVK